jgi:membrane associated rhomboid family serine protease
MTYMIYLGFYITTRLLLPRSARDFVVAVAVVPAVLAFLLGGISMGGGYFIWAYMAAPLLGVLFGAALMPGRTQRPSHRNQLEG